MTIVRISKQRIIEAISSEPLRNLRSGDWALPEESQALTVGAKDCPVCAVGAVMRAVLDPEQDPDWLYSAAVASTSVETPLCAGGLEGVIPSKREVKKAPMVALSGFFEQECADAKRRTHSFGLSRHQMRRIRKKVIEFVEENFPPTMLIDIDGAKPARDVRVVKK